MEHPRDVGDRSTLAIMAALREQGSIYCPETSGVYLVPIDEAPLRTSGSLRVDPPRNSQQLKIRLAADYEIGRVQLERR